MNTDALRPVWTQMHYVQYEHRCTTSSMNTDALCPLCTQIIHSFSGKPITSQIHCYHSVSNNQVCFKTYLLIINLAIFTATFGYICGSVTSGSGRDGAETWGMAGQISTTLEQPVLLHMNKQSHLHRHAQRAWGRPCIIHLAMNDLNVDPKYNRCQMWTSSCTVRV
jgi:hypothetical protein